MNVVVLGKFLELEGDGGRPPASEVAREPCPTNMGCRASRFAAKLEAFIQEIHSASLGREKDEKEDLEKLLTF